MSLDLKVIISYLDRLGPGVKKAESDLESFAAKAAGIGRTMAVAGAAITGSMMASLHAAAEYGAEINRASKKTGVAVEDLSRLRYAAEHSGVAFDTLQMGLFRMQRAAGMAAAGSAEQQAAFDALGISVTDAGGRVKNSEQLFLELSDALKALPDDSERARLGQAIFGRGVMQLFPMLKRGSETLQEYTERAKALGLVWSQEGADAASRYKKSLEDVKLATQGLGRTLVTSLGPAISETMEHLAESIGKFTVWADKHPEAAAKITKAAFAIGLALGVGGPILMALPFLVAGMKTVIGWFGAEATAATDAAVATELAAARMSKAGVAAGAAGRFAAVLAIIVMLREAIGIVNAARAKKAYEEAGKMPEGPEKWEAQAKALRDMAERGKASMFGATAAVSPKVRAGIEAADAEAARLEALAKAYRELTDAQKESGEAGAESAAVNQQQATTLNDVLTVLGVIKAAYQGIIDKQREWVAGISEAAGARTELAQAWLNLLEAQPQTGPAIERATALARQNLIAAQVAQGTQVIGAGARAKWLPLPERQRIIAGGLGAYTAAAQETARSWGMEGPARDEFQRGRPSPAPYAGMPQRQSPTPVVIVDGGEGFVAPYVDKRLQDNALRPE